MTIYQPLSTEEERIGKAIVETAYKVHKELGPGLLEKVYEACFCHVLTKAGFDVKRQMDSPGHQSSETNKQAPWITYYL